MFKKYILPFQGSDNEVCHRVASVIMAYAFDIPEDVQLKDENDAVEDNEDDLISDDGEEERITLSMVPLADMLNADAHRNNARLCCDNESLEMRTVKPIKKGEEIFNDYGQLPRSDLLRRYGYVTENYAPFDVIELSTPSILHFFTAIDTALPVRLDPLDNSQLLARVDLAKREGVYEESYDLFHPGPDGPSIPEELLALLYLLLVDVDGFVSISSSNVPMPSRSKLATALVGDVLVALLHRKEAEYATTLEEDEMVSTDTKSRRGIFAVQVRVGEKRVLKSAIQEASSMAGSNKQMRISDRQQQDLGEHGKRRMRQEESSSPHKKTRLRR